MTSSVSLLRRIRRTPYQSIAAVFMIFVTLFVTALFFLLAMGSSAILTYFETKPQLTVFFKDEKNKDSVDDLVSRLKGTGKISSTNYISKEQALAIYREQNKNDPLLLEMVTADILPASLEISAVSPQYMKELYDYVSKEPGVDEVIYQKDIVDTLVSWTSTMRKIGMVFITFLVFSTFFILLTSIGMKIALRRDEIDILKLVGATSWYIRRPFIYEGMIYGVIGSFFAWVATSGLFLYMRPFVASFLRGIPVLNIISAGSLIISIWPPSVILFLYLLVILLLAGLSIGLIGSLFAVSRYMRN